MSNRSSVYHNILTGEQNDYSSNIGIAPPLIDKKITFKKKGITDLYNHQQKYSIRINLDHQIALKSKPDTFKKSMGQFTYTINESKRFGLVKVFRDSRMISPPKAV